MPAVFKTQPSFSVTWKLPPCEPHRKARFEKLFSAKNQVANSASPKAKRKKPGHSREQRAPAPGITQVWLFHFNRFLSSNTNPDTRQRHLSLSQLGSFPALPQSHSLIFIYSSRRSYLLLIRKDSKRSVNEW